MADQVDRIRQAAGTRFETIELSVVASLMVTDDRLRGAGELADKRGWQGVPVDSVLDIPARPSGSERSTRLAKPSARGAIGLVSRISSSPIETWRQPPACRARSSRREDPVGVRMPPPVMWRAGPSNGDKPEQEALLAELGWHGPARGAHQALTGRAPCVRPA